MRRDMPSQLRKKKPPEAYRVGAAIAILTLLACGPMLADGEEFAIKNVGITRTMSAFGGPLRTNKIEANGAQLLQQPGVEFMIDLDYKGEPVSLSPADFEIKGVDTIKDGKELRTSLRLQCVYDGIPLIMFLRYHRDPAGAYQQKSITMLPCKEAPGAVLRRVTLEDLVLKPEFVPVMPCDGLSGNPTGDPRARFRFGEASSFAAIDRNSKRGVFFFVTSLSGKEGIGRNGSLRMWENAYVPLAKGYETGRATIGAVTGPPEVLFKRFREFLWENYRAARPSAGSGSTGSKWQVRPSEGEPVTMRKSDVLAGKLPDTATQGKARAVELVGDDWLAGSAYIKEPEFAALTACREACRKLREANRGIIIRLSPESMPPAEQVHWLGTVDRVVLAGGPGEDGLAARRLRYSRAFIFPALTLDPEFDAGLYTKDPLTVPGKLAPYLGVYQHILDFPDGKNVCGEGHIIDSKGFIVLFNPASEPRKVAIPLDEPELELKGSVKLADWTKPDSPADLGTVRVGDKVEVELAPASTKIIGVNL